MEYRVFPYFQPILETTSGRIVGYEALARMHDARGRVVSAGRLFGDAGIPLEERIRLDREVRFQALSRVGAFPGEAYLSINISPEWIEHLDLSDSALTRLPTLEMVQSLGVDPARVVVEITELDGDIQMIQRAVRRYREAGFRIAIDDFGADFSQLDRMMLIRPDIVKLDMRLIEHGLSDDWGATIVQMLGETASKLGCRVLCEGVESEAAYFLALSSSAFYTQGFLFTEAVADPLSPEQFCARSRMLLGEYRNMAVEATARNHWRAERVGAELATLREKLRGGSCEQLCEEYHPAPELLRFYLCDREGNQISPNYENREGRWSTHERSRGLNWSWRPYFFELVGAQETCDRLVFSEPYRDIHSGRRTQTAALFLDRHRILLADLVEEQSPLKAPRCFGRMPSGRIAPAELG